MKKLSMCMILALALFPGACAMGGHMGHGGGSRVPVYAEGVNWYSLAEGKGIALEQRKPMVVDFAVPSSCDRCDFLQEYVYNREEIVAKINADFIPIWVNLDASSHTQTDEERALGRKFSYGNDCLLLFLDHEGNLLEDPEGKKLCFAEEVEPEDFNRYLDHVRTRYVPAPASR